MIAIIAAMDIEVELLKEASKNSETSLVCGMQCTSGKLENREVVIIKSGIGKAAAASATAVAISVFGADKVINTGLAAGKFPVGTVMVADKCVQYDFDMTADGCPLGQNSDFDSPFFYADAALSAALSRALEKAGVDYETTAIASGDAFVADAEKMRRICADFGAGGVEMESGSVAQVCTKAGVPFAILRAVSDNGDSMADFNAFAPKVCKIFTDALIAALGSDDF
ncbi:MAG: 5'-methylthioadenosine/adenosylhomocysteine nucleosidase [Clostridia bacterium]|nr:5'-methylthioadenosine/adenosylhomocysteine nucleosidase [Clostridia bacterium]